MIDNVRTVKKTQKIHEVEFMMLGYSAPSTFYLLLDQGDSINELPDRFEIVRKSADPVEFRTVFKQNLLEKADRIRIVEIPEPGESALDKHLEQLRQEQSVSQLVS